MPDKVSFSVQQRSITGKKVKQLRTSGKTPANIHGDLKNSTAIEFDTQAFLKLYEEVGDTGLVYIQVGEEKKQRPVLVDEVSYDTLTGELEHVVLKQVNLKEKITAEVPVELVGESEVADVVIVTVQDEVTVEALPTDFPEKIELDISVLTEIGQSITYRDIRLPAEVTLMIEEEQLDEPLVLLQEQKEEEPEEEPVPEEGEAAEGGGGEESETAAEEKEEKAEDSEKAEESES